MEQPNILKSRKFWLMIADVSISTATYFITLYVAPAIGQNILWLIGSWQPVIIYVINAMAQENIAAIAKG
jgi:hypothetical protein